MKKWLTHLCVLTVLGVTVQLLRAQSKAKAKGKVKSDTPVKVTIEDKLKRIRARVQPELQTSLAKLDLRLGLPIFIRVFKESNELEVWMQPQTVGQWRLFKIYPIKTYGGGTLGPKLKQGDNQAPEGFYSISPKAMNPASSYHLSFNVGYPNAYDQAHTRTGSLIMVHGREVSIGCFAMGDPAIEQIYLLAESAFAKGQPNFNFHSFPFRMTEARLKQAEEGEGKNESAATLKTKPWLAFWRSDLLPGYQVFELNRIVPAIGVTNKGYVIHGK